MVQSVVGETAAQDMKIVVPGMKRPHKSFQVLYVDIGNLREPINPRHELLIADREGLVWTKSGKNSRRQIGLCDRLMMTKIIGGIVRGAHDFNAKLLKNGMRRQTACQ